MTCLCRMTTDDRQVQAASLLELAGRIEAQARMNQRRALEQAAEVRQIAALFAARCSCGGSGTPQPAPGPKPPTLTPVPNPPPAYVWEVVRVDKARVRLTWGEVGAYADVVGPIEPTKNQLVSICRGGVCEARGHLKAGGIEWVDVRGKQATSEGKVIVGELARRATAYLNQEASKAKGRGAGEGGDVPPNDTLH